MRVSTNLMQMLGTQAILDRQADVNRTQLQISTGRRIQSPADDPTGSARLLELNKFIDGIDQFGTNSEIARARPELEEVTLASATDVLQRARELAVLANNDTVSAESRAGLAIEVRGLIDQMMALANTRDPSGEYLFAGYQVDSIPFEEVAADTFAYRGDQGERSVQIGSSRFVSDRDNGSDVFMNIIDSGGAIQDVFTSIAGFAQNLESDTPTGDDITNLDLALDHFIGRRASVGGRLNTIDRQAEVNQVMKIDAQSVRGELEDLDMAEAISRFNLELLAFQAAEQSFVKIQNLSLFNFL